MKKFSSYWKGNPISNYSLKTLCNIDVGMFKIFISTPHSIYLFIKFGRPTLLHIFKHFQKGEKDGGKKNYFLTNA